MNACALIIDNRPEIEPIIEAHAGFIPKHWDILWIKNENTNTANEYNQLLTSKRLWRGLPEKVLIFQADSMLLRNGVEDFLEWDFIGANIPKIPGCMNGGLSIRDSKAMLKVLDKISWSPQLGNEDVFFCNALRTMGGNLPTVETSRMFSVEGEFNYGSVGYHAIDKWLTPSECQAIRNQYNKSIA